MNEPTPAGLRRFAWRLVMIAAGFALFSAAFIAWNAATRDDPGADEIVERGVRDGAAPTMDAGERAGKGADASGPAASNR